MVPGTSPFVPAFLVLGGVFLCVTGAEAAEFATLRLRLLKIAARVTETKNRVRIAFAAACPQGRPLRQHACCSPSATHLNDGVESRTSFTRSVPQAPHPISNRQHGIGPG
jgi:hypothetical protein